MVSFLAPFFIHILQFVLRMMRDLSVCFSVDSHSVRQSHCHSLAHMLKTEVVTSNESFN